MKIYIKYLNDSKITIENIDGKELILELKNKIFNYYDDKVEKDKNCVENQKLVFTGKVLENDKTLNEYKIENENTLFCVLSKKKLNQEQPTETNKNSSPEENIQQNTNENNIPNPFANNVTGTNPFSNLDFSQLFNNQLLNQNMSNMYQNPELINLSMELFRDPEASQLITQLSMNPNLMSNPEFIGRLFSNPLYNNFLMRFMEVNRNSGVEMNNLTNINSQNIEENSNNNEGYNNSEEYQKEVDEMVSLGFPNRENNLYFLRRTNGDVNSAINLLLDLSS